MERRVVESTSWRDPLVQDFQRPVSIPVANDPEGFREKIEWKPIK